MSKAQSYSLIVISQLYGICKRARQIVYKETAERNMQIDGIVWDTAVRIVLIDASWLVHKSIALEQ